MFLNIQFDISYQIIIFFKEEHARLQQENRERQMEVRTNLSLKNVRYMLICVRG